MSDTRLRTTSLADGKQAEADPSLVLTGLSVYQTDGGTVTSVAAQRGNSGQSDEISYSNTKIIGNGSFGIVFKVYLHNFQRDVALKKVLQDRKFKNRELAIMKTLSHPNITELYYYFHSTGQKKDEVYLNLVIEYVPENLSQLMRRLSSESHVLPAIYAKLLRALAYLHHRGICHRDIKPHNVLVDATAGVLKICDFGSAKMLVRGESNVAYICSRYYRAPELIFGAVHYTTAIDVWSAGCVFAEMFLLKPLFRGDSGVDQLVEIIKVLGTPSKEHIEAMNPTYKTFQFPQVQRRPWSEVLPPLASEDAFSLCSAMLDYTPQNRTSALQALAHPLFDELKHPASRLRDGPLPPLFNFTEEEFSFAPDFFRSLAESAGTRF